MRLETASISLRTMDEPKLGVCYLLSRFVWTAPALDWIRHISHPCHPHPDMRGYIASLYGGQTLVAPGRLPSLPPCVSSSGVEYRASSTLVLLHVLHMHYRVECCRYLDSQVDDYLNDSCKVYAHSTVLLTFRNLGGPPPGRHHLCGVQ
jgi:hypothetical protein